MSEKLRCFISASNDIDTSIIKNLLGEYDVEAIDVYDFSIGDSIQQILKRKIRQADFAVFLISDETSNTNVIYEMGVCEGIGKQHFVFLEKQLKIPFYIQNHLFIRVDFNSKDFLRSAIEKILLSVTKKERQVKHNLNGRSLSKSYDNQTKENLKLYLDQTKELRISGNGKELESIIEKVFKTVRLDYVENETNKDSGIDFALWNDNLGKILGNPIIVELKYGNLNKNIFLRTEQQLLKYIEKSEVRVALLLYLDKTGKRHETKPSLNPLILSYDVEDFITGLLNNSFENLILSQRNKIAHGV